MTGIDLWHGFACWPELDGRKGLEWEPHRDGARNVCAPSARVKGSSISGSKSRLLDVLRGKGNGRRTVACTPGIENNGKTPSTIIETLESQPLLIQRCCYTLANQLEVPTFVYSQGEPRERAAGD